MPGRWITGFLFFLVPWAFAGIINQVSHAHTSRIGTLYAMSGIDFYQRALCFAIFRSRPSSIDEDQNSTAKYVSIGFQRDAHCGNFTRGSDKFNCPAITCVIPMTRYIYMMRTLGLSASSFSCVWHFYTVLEFNLTKPNTLMAVWLPESFVMPAFETFIICIVSAAAWIAKISLWKTLKSFFD